MADNADQVPTDSGQSVDTDTSDHEETSERLDFDSDNLFDDIDVSDVKEEPEPDTDDEAATESEEKETAEPSDDVAEETPDEEEPEAPSDEPDTGKEQKQRDEELARARFEERKAKREADAVRQAAEDERIERYLKEAEDDEIEFEKRQLDVQNYRLTQERISMNEERLQTQVERAYADIDLFTSGSPKAKERMLKALDTFEALHVQKDRNGRPTKVTGDVYQYLQAEAADIRDLLGDGARNQETKKTSQKARTMTPPVKSPKKEKTDPGQEAFDAEAYREW